MFSSPHLIPSINDFSQKAEIFRAEVYGVESIHRTVNHCPLYIQTIQRNGLPLTAFNPLLFYESIFPPSPKMDLIKNPQ